MKILFTIGDWNEDPHVLDVTDPVKTMDQLSDANMSMAAAGHIDPMLADVDKRDIDEHANNRNA